MPGVRVKKRTFTGAVCEQQVWTAPRHSSRLKDALPPDPAPEDEEGKKKHREGISRRKFIRLVNSNFTPKSIYSTLTFSDEYEVHTFEDARRIRKNFVRRLQRSCPDARIVIVMGRGRSTSRIHMHMISDGIPEEIIKKKWVEGKIIENKNLRSHNWYNRVDHGQDYTGLAVYLHNHWSEEQGGHHWYGTKNLREPEVEKTKEIKREYSPEKPPRAPKGFIYISCEVSAYGCYTFKYVVDPGPDPRRTKKKNKK